MSTCSIKVRVSFVLVCCLQVSKVADCCGPVKSTNAASVDIPATCSSIAISPDPTSTDVLEVSCRT
ncbi:unnamed protein product [Echinostoma caproni]|uniref:AAI domain-containing protein n=1 Tax=Echinostoma caproni TaxID=27848 RepID=A0A183A2K2_9TREM|nr:unnamed protein product [Echinostoma caproni]